MSDQQAARSSDHPFGDLLAANERYRSTAAHDATIEGRAGRGLAVLTCMDTRLDPLAVLGLAVGDAKIVRNAGARPTDDALRSLVLATNLLGVTRIALIGHTRCAMFSSSEAELRELISTRTGNDASGWEFLAGSDQVATIRDDLAAIRTCPLIPAGTVVAGFLFDVDTGELTPVDG